MAIPIPNITHTPLTSALFCLPFSIPSFTHSPRHVLPWMPVPLNVSCLSLIYIRHFQFPHAPSPLHTPTKPGWHHPPDELLQSQCLAACGALFMCLDALSDALHAKHVPASTQGSRSCNRDIRTGCYERDEQGVIKQLLNHVGRESATSKPLKGRIEYNLIEARAMHPQNVGLLLLSPLS